MLEEVDLLFAVWAAQRAESNRPRSVETNSMARKRLDCFHSIIRSVPLRDLGSFTLLKLLFRDLTDVTRWHDP